jgi:hypothetical protein
MVLRDILEAVEFKAGAKQCSDSFIICRGENNPCGDRGDAPLLVQPRTVEVHNLVFVLKNLFYGVLTLKREGFSIATAHENRDSSVALLHPSVESI